MKRFDSWNTRLDFEERERLAVLIKKQIRTYKEPLTDRRKTTLGKLQKLLFKISG